MGDEQKNGKVVPLRQKSKKEQVADLIKEVIPKAKPVKKASKKTSAPKKSVQMTAQGNNIVQVGGNVAGGINIKNTTKKVNVSVQPPPGTIGANPFLVERITGMFNELGLRREKRITEKSAYSVMYGNFKKAFSIPTSQKYTVYLLWPESRAVEIIDYLQTKLDNTIKGRNQKAASRKWHTAPYLLGETSRLHKLLGWTGQEYRGRLHYLFGVTSRADLSLPQLANYVEYLKGQIDGQD